MKIIHLFYAEIFANKKIVGYVDQTKMYKQHETPSNGSNSKVDMNSEEKSTIFFTATEGGKKITKKYCASPSNSNEATASIKNMQRDILKYILRESTAIYIACNFTR